MGLLAGLALAASFFFTVITVDESQTQICRRQARTQVAVPYLINSMDNIHSLLTIPAPKGHHESPEVAKLVQSLDDNLATFVRIERNQKPISCS